MAKFTDFESVPEALDIIEKLVAKLPNVFSGFKLDQIAVIGTKNKKSKNTVKPVPVKYPHSVYLDYTYIFEVFLESWNSKSREEKCKIIFRAMCMIPFEGFDFDSKNYGKICKPQIQLYINEVALYKGIPGWPGSDVSRNPEEIDEADIAVGVNQYDDFADTNNDENEDTEVSRIPVDKDAIIVDE